VQGLRGGERSMVGILRGEDVGSKRGVPRTELDGLQAK